MSDLNKHHVFVPLRLYRQAGEKLLAFVGKEKNLDWVAKVVLVFPGGPFAMAVEWAFITYLVGRITCVDSVATQERDKEKPPYRDGGLMNDKQ